jgi:erythromycin esterase
MRRTAARPQDLARPLRDPGDLDPLLERIGEARIVCVGEASHGTHEYYSWRAALTRRLIEEKGFDLVAVEGDWPDCLAVSHCVTGSSDAAADPEEVLRGFARWPTWMWANRDVLDFVTWLRQENQSRPAAERVGFYGLDVYSLWESLQAVADYLTEHHPEHRDAAVRAFRCFEPYAEDPQAYARATRLVPEGCELEVVSLLGDLLERHRAVDVPDDDRSGRDVAFEAEQNARAVVDAEAYYRAMVRGGPDSWNVRDRHMAGTLDRLLAHHEDAGRVPSRAVVWEHNTHVGDARFTDMAAAGMVNVGQLVRERYGDADCVLVGFGSHSGSVIAAPEWGLPMREMRVPAARRGSTEELLHDELAADAALFVFPPERPGWTTSSRDHRAIGVVYRPEAERWGNYVPTVLGRRYDAFLWIDRTSALQPLHAVEPVDEEQETWPFGA